jgi:membrane-bound lytic murein transglycosylase MltF
VKPPALAAVVVFVCSASSGLAQTPQEKGRLGLALTPVMTKWTGDLDGMAERRLVRVLTVFSKTLYFIDRGTPRGTAYDQGKLLETFLNKKFASGHLTVNVQFIPLSRNELIPALLDGRGDVVMADLTVTPERARTVDFTLPWIAGVEEIVVTKPDAPPVASVEDLSGREIFVRESSSYYQSLVKLNEQLAAAGRPPAKLVPAPEELEDEDLLEMANAGLVDTLVVDNHKAWFWQRVLPKLNCTPPWLSGKAGRSRGQSARTVPS